MLLSATSMAALLTACGGGGDGVGGGNALATILGAMAEDQTLTANLSVTAAASIAHQWQSGGVNITDANNDTYVLTQDDVGAATLNHSDCNQAWIAN